MGSFSRPVWCAVDGWIMTDQGCCLMSFPPAGGKLIRQHSWSVIHTLAGGKLIRQHTWSVIIHTSSTHSLIGSRWFCWSTGFECRKVSVYISASLLKHPCNCLSQHYFMWCLHHGDVMDAHLDVWSAYGMNVWRCLCYREDPVKKRKCVYLRMCVCAHVFFVVEGLHVCMCIFEGLHVCACALRMCAFRGCL